MSAVAKPEQIHDLFSVPAGTVPQVDPEHGVDHSPSFPAEIRDAASPSAIFIKCCVDYRIKLCLRRSCWDSNWHRRTRALSASIW